MKKVILILTLMMLISIPGYAYRYLSASQVGYGTNTDVSAEYTFQYEKTIIMQGDYVTENYTNVLAKYYYKYSSQSSYNTSILVYDFHGSSGSYHFADETPEEYTVMFSVRAQVHFYASQDAYASIDMLFDW